MSTSVCPARHQNNNKKQTNKQIKKEEQPLIRKPNPVDFYGILQIAEGKDKRHQANRQSSKKAKRKTALIVGGQNPVCPARQQNNNNKQVNKQTDKKNKCTKSFTRTSRDVKSKTLRTATDSSGLREFKFCTSLQNHPMGVYFKKKIRV